MDPQVKVRAKLFVQMLFNFGRLCMSKVEPNDEKSPFLVERLEEAGRNQRSRRWDFCTFQVQVEEEIEYRLVTFTGRDEDSKKFYDQLCAAEGAQVIVSWSKELQASHA